MFSLTTIIHTRRGFKSSSVATGARSSSTRFASHSCCLLPSFAWTDRRRKQQQQQQQSRRHQYASTLKSPSQPQLLLLPHQHHHHQPPLPVRIALVSSTTALATPAFPALGFLYLVLRITTPDPNLRRLMEGRWGTLLSFTTWTLLPQMYGGAVASLVLPCAIGNAIVAGGVYGVVDVACNHGNYSFAASSSGSSSSSSGSGASVLQYPMIGTGIGMTVGYIAPNFMYGPIMEQFYSLEGMSQSIQQVMAFPYATEVSVVTGAIAGTFLHPLLYYPIHGVPGLHWKYFSGVALAGVTSALFYVYYGRREVGLPVPEGSYIHPSQLEIVNSIPRYNTVSGKIEAYSLYKQAFIGSIDQCRDGMKLAEKCRSYIAKSKSGKNVVFDDRVLAFVYNYWDVNVKTRCPDHVINNIKSKEELRQIQKSMALTDLHVAAVLQRERLDETTQLTYGTDMTSFQSIIDELSSTTEGEKLLTSSEIKQAGDTLSAIELLMILKQKKKQNEIDVSVQKLEQFVHSRCPGVILYTADEQYDGESIESQLHIAKWKGPELSTAIAHWNQVQKLDTRRVWLNRSLVAVCGIVLSIVGSIQHSRYI